MIKITALLKKVTIIILVFSVGLATMPLTNVLAAGLHEESTPTTQPKGSRLEKVWARELAAYERQGKLLDRSEALVDKVQTLIDKAEAKGWNVSAVQIALDDFEKAFQDARPIHNSATGIVTSHKGFDNNGKVTDRVQALDTVKELGQHLRDFREAMDGTEKALFEAIKTFREAHKPAQPPATSTP